MPRSFLLKRSAPEKTQTKGRNFGSPSGPAVKRSYGPFGNTRSDPGSFWSDRKSAVHNGGIDYFASYKYQSFIDGDVMHQRNIILQDENRNLNLEGGNGKQNAFVKIEGSNVVPDAFVGAGIRDAPGIKKAAEATSVVPNSTITTTAAATTGTGKPVYKCEQCGKTFKTKYTLTIHLKMPNHTGARPFVCNICGKGFRLSSTLCRHKIIHTSDKPHQCHICQKAFNRSSTLKTHIRTHSEKKEFLCDVCGKGFHQKGNLRNHFLIHTGEKPYRCRLCNKAFNKLSNLKFHLHVHTDNTPYRCRNCKTAFSRRCDLKQHVQTCDHKGSDLSEYFDDEEDVMNT